MKLDSGTFVVLDSQYYDGRGETIFGGSVEIDIFGGDDDSSISSNNSDKPVSEVKEGAKEDTEELQSIIVSKKSKTTKKELYKKLLKSHFIT